MTDSSQTQDPPDNKDTRRCKPNWETGIALDKGYFFRPQDMQGQCLGDETDDKPATLEGALACDRMVVEAEIEQDKGQDIEDRTNWSNQKGKVQ